MQAVHVISKNGERLMPTTRYGKVRHLLKDGKAKIIKHKPFTIQLLYDSTSYTQPVEVCVDSGYIHIGFSEKSKSQEYTSAEYDLLEDEKERHDDQRKYRRARRNRKRYRRPHWNGKAKDWIAPSLKNKADVHIRQITKIMEVSPVTDVYIEVGQFDIQLLDAIEQGKVIPDKEDYQHGGRYGYYTLREAVFSRDGYKCAICGRTAYGDGAILHEHHMYFWRGQHGSRMDELITVCEKCHTPQNHKPGGALYGLDKKLPRLDAPAYMNTVKWYIYNCMCDALSKEHVHLTYGSKTKEKRTAINIEKTHANDAYSMGEFHPVKRIETEYYKKHRRNNRILEKFTDAVYIDVRDGSKKKGSQIGCERTNRREPRMSDKNLRIYHGEKISKGKRSVRKRRYPVRPGDLVYYFGENPYFKGKTFRCKGMLCEGARIVLCNKGTSPTGKQLSDKVGAFKVLYHVGAWEKLSPEEIAKRKVPKNK